MPSVSKKQHNFMAAVANNPKFAKQAGIKQSVGEEFMKADKGRKFAKGGVTRHEDEAMDKKVAKKAIAMHDKQLHGGKKTDLAKLKKGGKIKKYEDGGLTFADMDDIDRDAAADAAIQGINARQAAASEAAGGASTIKTTPRRAAPPKAPTASRKYRDEGSQGIAKMAANPAVVGKPKSAAKVSLEEYSAKSPWNTRGTKALYGSEKATSPKKGAMEDLMDTVRKAPKLMKSGGSVGASKRADGCATKGKTKGTMVKMCGGGMARKGK